MQIEFVAHATFKIILNDGRILVIDPYQAMSFQGRFNYPKFDDYCDFAVITHEHIDHNYLGDLRGNPVIVRNSWHDKGLDITSIHCWHDKYNGTKFGGSVQIKCISADGIRLCHLGDCGECLSDAQIHSMGKVDVLIIPVGGFYTIDGDEAALLADRIGARIIIPCHYLTSRCSLKLEDASRFLSHYPHRVHLNGIIDVQNMPDGVVMLDSRY